MLSTENQVLSIFSLFPTYPNSPPAPHHYTKRTGVGSLALPPSVVTCLVDGDAAKVQTFGEKNRMQTKEEPTPPLIHITPAEAALPQNFLFFLSEQGQKSCILFGQILDDGEQHLNRLIRHAVYYPVVDYTHVVELATLHPAFLFLHSFEFSAKIIEKPPTHHRQAVRKNTYT